ncbi:hypothetical protein HFO39_22870 [Rhizobium leguminosarum]|uniref:hypothetical protein n=1 Tax=Rhizobium leguminosarum TaxID=384 RepID=UPI001C93985E|nr:hypothetical protein [Rhizobium leguminosarum]MBY5637575.1 hypothetical protein [Rhizobium leguminosarum]
MNADSIRQKAILQARLRQAMQPLLITNSHTQNHETHHWMDHIEALLDLPALK